jgi:hypothetical protein
LKGKTHQEVIMKNPFKRLLSILLVMVLSFTLSLGAFAAPSSDIKVQIGEKTISFTDQEPVIINGRTFLPVRAVFEALGAEVTYHPETKTAQAVRGNTSVQLASGSDTMTVTRGGATQTIKMDVACFIENNRMMVPTRFAAEAFGCSVGWDAEDKTVIILDVDSLLDKNNAQYTLMDKLMSYGGKFSQGVSVAGTFDFSFKINSDGTMIPVVSSGTINEIVDSNAVNMDIHMTTDLQSLIDRLKAEEVDDDTVMLLTMLKDVKMEYIYNIKDAMMYIRCPLLSNLTGEDPNAWFSTDLKAFYSELKLDINTITDLATVQGKGSQGFANYLKDYVRQMPLTDTASAATMAQALSLINSSFSDGAFTQSGNTYTSICNIDGDGTEISLSLSLKLSNDALVGYGIAFSVTDGDANLSIKIAMDENDKMDVSLDAFLEDVFEIDIDATLRYSKPTKPAVTSPAAGSVIIPME